MGQHGLATRVGDRQYPRRELDNRDVVDAFAGSPDPIALHIDAGEAGGTATTPNAQGHDLRCNPTTANPQGDCGAGSPITLDPADGPVCGIDDRFYELKRQDFDPNRR